jgi:hypothetical protein
MEWDEIEDKWSLMVRRVRADWAPASERGEHGVVVIHGKTQTGSSAAFGGDVMSTADRPSRAKFTVE